MFFPLVFCFGTAAGCLLAGKILLHYFQLESYQFPGYFRTIRRNLLKAVLPGILMSALLFITCISLNLMAGENSPRARLFYVLSFPILLLGGYGVGTVFYDKKAKKAFVITSRVKRLYLVSIIILTVILVLIRQILMQANPLWRTVFCLFPFLLPLWISLCGLLAWPVEKLISELYFRDAQRILRDRKDLIRIGITGSWGKTSVKFILGTILEEKFHTLVTPASFNTPMGVTKIIRTRLEPGHRIFVAEMGARHVGDIKEMCRLVHPQIGIITSVGPQHLDTFKTQERITRTKYELIQALPENGQAFFADDEGICRGLYQKTTIARHISGLDSEKDEVTAESIRYSPAGSAFLLCYGDKQIKCETQLLGELNIRNILLCACVALNLGMTLDQVARGIQKIQPVEHRLQLIRHPGGINIIDDAFNSNIRGAKQAFQVLKQFPDKRIVVTPGMVELGDCEYDMNRDFGSAMADCCDTAVLIGKKRSEAIAAGLKDRGFPESSILIVSSLEEATGLLNQVASSGDTILFENDLPDNYSEL